MKQTTYRYIAQGLIGLGLIAFSMASWIFIQTISPISNPTPLSQNSPLMVASTPTTTVSQTPIPTNRPTLINTSTVTQTMMSSPTPTSSATATQIPATPTATQTPFQIILTVNGSLREGPGTTFARQTILTETLIVEPLAYTIIDDWTWYYIRTPDGQTGWIADQVVDDSQVTLANLVLQTPPPSPTPAATLIPMPLPEPTYNPIYEDERVVFDPLLCCTAVNATPFTSNTTVSKSTQQLSYVLRAKTELVFQNLPGEFVQIGLMVRDTETGVEQFVNYDDEFGLQISNVWSFGCLAFCNNQYLSGAEAMRVWIYVANFPFPAGTTVRVQPAFALCDTGQCEWVRDPQSYLMTLDP